MRVFYRLATVWLFLVVFPAGAAGTRVLVIGDMRSGNGNKNFVVSEKVIDDALEYAGEIDGIVLTGDYVESGSSAEQWRRFEEVYAEALEYPTFPCVGNHDDQDWWYWSWHYRRVFGVERWYAAEVDNVKIVSISSNLEGFNLWSRKGDLLELFQYVWFVNELQNTPDDMFTVVIFHEPAYGSHTFFGQGHGSNMFMRRRYIPPCEDYGVDLILAGHNHWYERTVPILDGEENSEGVVHVTTGGGGAPLVPTSPLRRDKVRGKNDEVLSELNESAYHYCLLEVSGGSAWLEAVEFRSHDLIDAFEVESR
jgi:3',5'-cyclic AMP phosphodiesterase CpdA